MKKKIWAILLLLIPLIIIFAVLNFNKKEKIVFDNSLPVATIIQSKYEGIDAGKEYVYTLYKSKKNGYNYKKETIEITISGPSTIKTETGMIKNKWQFNKNTKKPKGFDEYIYAESNNQMTRKELINQLF